MACLALVLLAPVVGGFASDGDGSDATPCAVEGSPTFLLHLSPPESQPPTPGVVSVFVDPNVHPSLGSALHSLESQFTALCGERSTYACVEDLGRQTAALIADVCGAGAVCAVSGDVVVQVSPNGVTYSKPVALEIPLAIDSERFPTFASVLEELQPQFEKVCGAQLFPAPVHWGLVNCSKEFERQTVSWIRGNCNMNVGYPWQEAHGSSAASGGGACYLAIVSAYVQVPGYSRRSRGEYLRNAMDVLPPLLTLDLQKAHPHKTCAVLFSDDKDFLDAVLNNFAILRRSGLNLGTIMTRLLAPVPQDKYLELQLYNGTELSIVPSRDLARNTALSRSAIPHDIYLKNGQSLALGVGRALAAGIWMQKFDLCAIAADLLPSTAEVHWRDLVTRVSTESLGALRPPPGSLLATIYPPIRPRTSLNFGGRAPCTAWAQGWFLAMCRADAHAHAEMFHSVLKHLVREGHGYLDEEIVIAWAANAGECRGKMFALNGIDFPTMDVRDMCSLGILDCDTQGKLFTG